MNRATSLVWLRLIAVTGFVAGLWFARTAQAQIGIDRASMKSMHGLSMIGVKECAACHSAPSPLYETLGVTKFVQMSEAKSWLTRDKHSYAYELVRQDLTDTQLQQPEFASNALSIRITNGLGWEPGDYNFETKCLVCHTGHPSDLGEIVREDTFGVTCEACHGPGSEYTKLANHQQPSWRTRTTAEKMRLGMRDLSSPSHCANVCLSCHLGDIEMGRFVTHEMYAKGHPVLPPFELQTYLDAMPRHWKTIQEKLTLERGEGESFLHQNLYLAAHFDGDASAVAANFERTHRSMLGALTVNDHVRNEIFQAADGDSASPTRWGDYSNYDCAGCHQELDTSKAKFRPAGRIPGRPFPSKWPELDYPAVHANHRDVFEEVTRNIDKAFNTLPFGSRSAIVSASTQHQSATAKRLNDRKKSERGIMTRADVQEWLQHLMASRRERLTDYWTARQTAWLMVVAIEELVDHQLLPMESVQSQLAILKSELKLDLKIPRDRSVLAQQPAILEHAQKFDHAETAKWMQSLVDEATAIR